MTITIEPVEVQSLKEACITRLEGLILSGQFKIGQQLPSERDLAEMLAVSRPVVHEALVEMAARGLVNIVPRRGAFVEDFRTNGSVAMLESLLAFQDNHLDRDIQRSMIDFRLLMERETARLAARHRSDDQLEELQDILQREQELQPTAVQERTELDVRFHHRIALASGNTVYPLILSSFKNIHMHLVGQFYRHIAPETLHEVFEFHVQLLAALRDQDELSAQNVMTAMLIHGAQNMPPEKE